MFPLLLSFDKKVAFYKHWSALFPSIFISATIFIIWDVWFTKMGVWGFNSLYLCGIYIYNLPLEEYLFFFTVPYACVFIYECLKVYLPIKESIEALHRWVTLFVFGTSVTLLYWFNDHLYTAITSLLLFLLSGTHLTVIRRRYMVRFYLAFILSVLPMLVVNGILTSFPVVYYHEDQIMGPRLGSIPIEDFLYQLTLLLMTVSLYEMISRLILRWRLRLRKRSS